MIFDNRLLWQTVSNTDDKSTSTQNVRSGGFLWFNPIASSSSWHQTSVFHLSTHFFAVSLNLLRSSNESPKPCTASNHLRREVSRLHTTQEYSSSTLAFSLPGSDHIESEPTLVSCLVISTRAHTSLRMSGGAIPASKYRSSTLVGFRHPVTALHALFSSGFSFWVGDDLAQAGAAYSATE